MLVIRCDNFVNKNSPHRRDICCDRLYWDWTHPLPDGVGFTFPRSAPFVGVFEPPCLTPGAEAYPDGTDQFARYDLLLVQSSFHRHLCSFTQTDHGTSRHAQETKLTRVGFWAHVKITSRIVSYSIAAIARISSSLKLRPYGAIQICLLLLLLLLL